MTFSAQETVSPKTLTQLNIWCSQATTKTLVFFLFFFPPTSLPLECKRLTGKSSLFHWGLPSSQVCKVNNIKVHQVSREWVKEWMSEEWYLQLPGFLLAHVCSFIKSINLYNDQNNKEMEASALGSDFLQGFLMECCFYKCSSKK